MPFRTLRDITYFIQSYKSNFSCNNVLAIIDNILCNKYLLNLYLHF